MRVLFWCDMEGIGGIVKWDQVMAGKSQYEEGRQLYTAEINAAVRGAKKGGAKEIIVVDGHGAGGDHSFNSLIKDQLEPGAEYVFGYRWGCYIEPLLGADAMLLPGAHAMAGTENGILSHTMSTENFRMALINGRAVGESGIVAAIAGSFDVPVIFVSGDEATCLEVKSLVGPTLHTVAVKKSLSRYAARCLAPVEACHLIEIGVEKVLRDRTNWPKPLKFVSPVELKVELADPDKSNAFKGKIGCEVLNPMTVTSKGENFWQAWDQFWYRS
ncbi:MAG: M55 family metallopeptidase [Ignavibacteriae bacterium]|nr:M55 family metallopeptidase [Ignavibacteriota bacterium]